MTAEVCPKVLVVEDDAKVRLVLRRCLESEKFRVVEAPSGRAATRQIERDTFDLVMLDLSLPDADGLTVAREIRSRSGVPILIVTGKGDPIDRVVGLELGADDYIVKPFVLRELLARVRAVLRRTGGKNAGAMGLDRSNKKVLEFADWRLDLAKRQLKSKSDVVCKLTTGEFDLLALLAGNPGLVLSRDQIISKLHGHDRNPTDRTIDNLVVKLRRKIGDDCPDRQLIQTVRGVGYCLTADVAVHAD